MITLTRSQMAKILLASILLGIIMGSCRAEEIDINKIIQIESSGNPHAYNKNSGCIGLMQINPKGALADWNYKEKKESDKIIKAHEKEWEKYNKCQDEELNNLSGVGVYYSACFIPALPFGLFSIKTYELADLYNPKINVEIGTWYINKRIPQMIKAYGLEDTIEYRLIAYNWGIGNLLKHLKKPLPKETRDYIRKYRRLK